jgi:putative oxidoreductase
MDVLILIGLLLLGGLLNFIKEFDIKSASRLAGIYIFIAIVAAMYTWIHYFVGIGDADLLKVLNVFLQVINSMAHALLGYLVAYIILNFQQLTDQTENPGLKNVIRLTRWAISISIANTFILATAGKSQNMAYMLDFFRQSGYANWFLYFIMSAETLGALGILFHNKLKTGPLAAWGLIIIMLGAVYTHLHNHDPFSDSYAAVIQLINLSLLLLVYYFEKQVNKMHPVTPIYVV